MIKANLLENQGQVFQDAQRTSTREASVSTEGVREASSLDKTAFRRLQKRAFVNTVIVVITFGLIFAAFKFQEFKVRGALLKQESTLGALSQDVETKEKNIKKKSENYDVMFGEYAAKLDILKKFTAGRLQEITILDRLAQMTPEEIWFTSMKGDEKGFKITGRSLEMSSIFTLNNRLKAMNFFENVSVDRTYESEIEKRKVISFELSANYKLKEEKKK